MSDRTVGIIGGMGPEATVDLMSKVINLTPAKDDADHIRMIVDNNPKIPSRIKALIDKTGESPAPALVQIAQSLQAYGADFIVIPCNTAHHYYSDVAQAVTIPVLNMLELVVSHVRLKQPQIKKVGLLASTAVIGLKLYDRLFADHGIEVVAPQTPVQQTVMDSILQIKSGIKDHTTVAVLNEASNSLIPVLGIGVRAAREAQEANVFKLAEQTAVHLGIEGVVKREHVVANCDYVGAGYGIPTPGGIEAIELFARTESILLDPVYSAKGAAGLIDLIRKGHFKKDENIVFVHTGGSQALFGYRNAFDYPNYR